MTGADGGRPVLSFTGNPDEQEIAAILVALAVATGPRRERMAPPAPDPADPWGSPELIIHQHLAALSTLPHLSAAAPATPTVEPTPR